MRVTRPVPPPLRSPRTLAREAKHVRLREWAILSSNRGDRAYEATKRILNAETPALALDEVAEVGRVAYMGMDAYVVAGDALRQIERSDMADASVRRLARSLRLTTERTRRAIRKVGLDAFPATTRVPRVRRRSRRESRDGA